MEVIDAALESRDVVHHALLSEVLGELIVGALGSSKAEQLAFQHVLLVLLGAQFVQIYVRPVQETIWVPVRCFLVAQVVRRESPFLVRVAVALSWPRDAILCVVLHVVWALVDQ